MAWLLFLVVGFSLEASESLVRPFPNPVLRNEIVEFKPVKDHHLSLEAPQKCGTGNLLERSARSVKCQFTKSGESPVVVNVCDDKKSFCKPIELKIAIAQGKSTTAEVLVKNQNRNLDLKKKLVPGFTEGTPEELKKKAATLGKPVLVMISTDWCPPCNEAKEHLFRTESFQKLTENWLKIYVDGDKLESAAWKKVVPYYFYPTMVLLNSEFQEVSRFSGEIRISVFESWVQSEMANLKDPLVKVQARVEEQDQGGFAGRLRNLFRQQDQKKTERDRERLLRGALIRNDSKMVEKITMKNEFPSLRAELIRHRLANLGDDQKAKATLENELVGLLVKGDDWAEALLSLCQSQVEACKPHLASLSERQEFLKGRQGLTDSEKAFMLAEESYFLSSIYETLNDKQAQTRWAANCVEQMDKLPIETRKTRSVTQMLVPCLERKGDFSRAEKLLTELIKDYPNEPTFLVRLARAKRKQKKFPDSLALLERAESLAFGFNWLSSQILKTEVLLDMNRQPDARRVLARAIAEIDLEEGRDSTSQAYLARLRALQERTAK